MKKVELKELKDGTLVYNGYAEGTIKSDCGVKCIEILIPIDGMTNDSRYFDEKPEYWMLCD